MKKLVISIVLLFVMSTGCATTNMVYEQTECNYSCIGPIDFCWIDMFNNNYYLRSESKDEIEFVADITEERSYTAHVDGSRFRIPIGRGTRTHRKVYTRDEIAKLVEEGKMLVHTFSDYAMPSILFNCYLKGFLKAHDEHFNIQ